MKNNLNYLEEQYSDIFQKEQKDKEMEKGEKNSEILWMALEQLVPE